MARLMWLYVNLTQDKDEQIGYLGVVAESASIVSMLMIGRILDWAKSY